MCKKDAFDAKNVNTRLTKIFIVIFAPDERLPSFATLMVHCDFKYENGLLNVDLNNMYYVWKRSIDSWKKTVRRYFKYENVTHGKKKCELLPLIFVLSEILCLWSSLSLLSWGDEIFKSCLHWSPSKWRVNVSKCPFKKYKSTIVIGLTKISLS